MGLVFNFFFLLTRNIEGLYMLNYRGSEKEHYYEILQLKSVENKRFSFQLLSYVKINSKI